MTILVQLAWFVAWSEPPTREFRYLRATTKSKSGECKFVVSQEAKGWKIRAVTGSLSVSAAYDDKDNLLAAEVVQATGAKKTSSRVRGKSGRAEITSADGNVTEVDAPPGVIVTSAPDWTDVFLLCRRYDRAKGGKQSFPGLWVHPSKGAFRLTFTIQRTGKDTLELGGKKHALDRFIIHLRNKSEYTAWADENGLLVRLRPGSKGEPTYELLLTKNVDSNADAGAAFGGAALQPRDHRS
jgi:hypothetical protein